LTLLEREKLEKTTGKLPPFVPAFILAAVVGVQQAPPAWPDTVTARLEALALVQTLNAELLAGRSSTSTLETWCADHHLADPARIVADVVPGLTATSDPDRLRRLEVQAPADVRYRHVRLRCGTRVLSEADNWYVPSRLTAEMNRLLETTDTPFGRAVAPLEPYRRTFSVTLLWAPLPPGWENTGAALRDGAGTLDIPAALFEHRAILYTRDHRPFSEVREVYQRDTLAFEPPKRAKIVE
jgi:hypothetical protein